MAETAPDRPVASRAARAPRPGRLRPRLALLAAALTLVVVAGFLWGQDRGERPGPAVPLAGVGGVAASGQARMASHGSSRQMLISASDLPALRPGQYYEVWLLDPRTNKMLPVGVLPPQGEGRFTLPATVLGRYQAIDVSLEVDDGDPDHSTRSLLRGRYA